VVLLGFLGLSRRAMRYRAGQGAVRDLVVVPQPARERNMRLE
jgi:hypothetical protein